MSDSFVTPWTVAHWAPLSMRFPRQEYLSGLPSLIPWDLPDPRINPMSPALQADSLLSEPPGKLRGYFKKQNCCFCRRNIILTPQNTTVPLKVHTAVWIFAHKEYTLDSDLTLFSAYLRLAVLSYPDCQFPKGRSTTSVDLSPNMELWPPWLLKTHNRHGRHSGIF